jgi:hypothetical protein
VPGVDDVWSVELELILVSERIRVIARDDTLCRAENLTDLGHCVQLVLKIKLVYWGLV